MVPGLGTGQSTRNMMSAVISVSLSLMCTYKGTSKNRDTKTEKEKFSPSCPTIHACINGKLPPFSCRFFLANVLMFSWMSFRLCFRNLLSATWRKIWSQPVYFRNSTFFWWCWWQKRWVRQKEKIETGKKYGKGYRECKKKTHFSIFWRRCCY